MIPSEKLDQYIKHKKNVLLIGEAGIGKSHLVIDAFQRNNLKYLYFSCSTLDPWIHIIGCPREMTEDDGTKYLDLLRPKAFARDEIDAIFLDEYNRAKPQIKNAVMELIQFKSINGKKFNNLKIVWAAVNPETKDVDGDYHYDVERLDPAQKDRFHVIINMPYKCDRSYFVKKYGAPGGYAVDWWDDLEEKQRKEISPRRLDYALEAYLNGIDLRDCLPTCGNISKLIEEIGSGSIGSIIEETFKNKDIEKAREIINKENFFTSAQKKILGNKELAAFYLPLVKNKEKIISLASDNDSYDIVVKIKELKPIFIEYAKDNVGSKLTHRLRQDGVITEKVSDSEEFQKFILDLDELKNEYYLNDTQISDLCKNFSGIIDNNFGLWSKSSDDVAARSALFKTTEGRKKIYAQHLHKRVTDSPTSMMLLNLIQGIIMIIDRSQHGTLRKDFIGIEKFFYTCIFDLCKNENQNKEKYLDKLKCNTLNKVSNFISAFFNKNRVPVEI